MKMKCISLIGRILIGITAFCLAASGFGAQSARASPQAAKNLMFNLDFDTPKKVCVGQSVDIIVQASVTKMNRNKPAGQYRAFKKGSMQFRAIKGGFIEPTSQDIPVLWYGRPARVYKFSFYAQEAGRASMTINGELPGVGSSENTLSFDVLEKCSWNIRGNTDMGALLDSKAQYLFGWDFDGYYDIVGTIKLQEDGTISGKGTVTKFMDVPHGAVDDVSCQHVTPWQGNTTVEIEADPNAWAEEGMLKLQFHLAPMQVNSTTTACVSSSGAGSEEIPGYTIAAFDLNPGPIPAEGGSLNFNFQFPDGKGENPMVLIVTPEEAGP